MTDEVKKTQTTGGGKRQTQTRSPSVPAAQQLPTGETNEQTEQTPDDLAAQRAKQLIEDCVMEPEVGMDRWDFADTLTQLIDDVPGVAAWLCAQWGNE